jgi:rubrerythrin
MKNSSGLNRTGVESSPSDAGALVEGADAGVPMASMDGQALNRIRIEEAKDADTVGSVPAPGAVLLDLLGERLCFERTATRLYESLLCKLAAAAPLPGGPGRDELMELRDQELAHFHLLTDVIEQLGGDPTALTPSADVMTMAAGGLLAAVNDPRVSLEGGLKLALMAELADEEGWETLADLAEQMGHDDAAASFQQAIEEEEEHLARLRTWLSRALEDEAGLERELPEAAPPPQSPR